MNGLIKSPPQQPPLSNRNAYTTWPGGVDPTVPLYNTDNQKFGGARRRRNNTRKSRKTRRNNVNRKVNRKARRASRKSRRASRRSRRSRRIRGGYATCVPISSGSASIPMTASVCPEGYFEDKPVLIA
jgi:hypothetical protein